MCLNLALQWKMYPICDFCRNLLCKLSFWCFCGAMVFHISRSKISSLTGAWRHMRQGGYSSCVNILWKYEQSFLQWCCNVSIKVFGWSNCDVWFRNPANAIYFKAIFTQPLRNASCSAPCMIRPTLFWSNAWPQRGWTLRRDGFNLLFFPSVRALTLLICV